ncbi:ABC-2 type transporter [Halobacteriales archaeon QS_4_69_31]|nr:MAG: ABC-2 type transporter [Halobacteriales archaeon QS_4_69_31]
MSALSVARKDFRGARRSRLLWAAAVVLGLIAAFAAYVSGTSGQSADLVRRLFRLLTLVLAVLLPVVALVASYLAIAGEREGGGIKFMLSLPNTRRDVFVGKLASRLGIVAGGIVFMYVAAASVALTRHGAFPAGVVFGTLVLSLVYGGTFVSIAVSLSAAAASRSRAIAGAFGSYFVLVILYIFPVVQIPTMVRWVHTTLLGADPNPDLYNAVRYTSPFLAYRKSINLVMPADLRQTVFRSSLPADTSLDTGQVNAALPVYLSDEFSLVVFAFWVVVPLTAGYLVFERSDLE